jgi:hypothetical protein
MNRAMVLPVLESPNMPLRGLTIELSGRYGL